MIEGFLTEMVIRRTTEWFQQRHPYGPALTKVDVFPLLAGNWFGHLSVSNDRPRIHVLIHMRGTSIESFEIVEADAVICPTCRAAG